MDGFVEAINKIMPWIMGFAILGFLSLIVFLGYLVYRWAF